MNYAFGAIQWLAADAATTTYVVSGLGFQPKALRFSWCGLQSASSTGSETLHSRRGVGFCVGTADRRAIGSYSADAAATTDCAGGAFNDCVAVTLNGTGAADGKLDVSAIGSDGFTAIVDDQAPVNVTVFWEAWGGDDITVAAVGDIAEPAATGNVDYTVTGFVAGATDQVVMLAGCQSTAAVNTGQAADSGFYIGYASGSGAENIVICGNQDDASAASDTDGYCQGGQCVAMIVLAGGTSVNAAAALTQFGTNNFRLNWSARATTNRRSAFLAIKGGAWRVGEYTITGNSLNATATVSGLPFTPIGISLIGTRNTQSTSVTAVAQDRMMWGHGSSTSARQCMGTHDENGTDPTEINLVYRDNSVLVAPSTAGSWSAHYDIDAMTSDGFRIIVDLAGGVASEWQGYLAFGSAPIGEPPMYLNQAVCRAAFH